MSYVSRYLEPALVERLNHLQLSARSVVEGTTSGLHKSPFKGSSVEFRQHRFYVPGDEPRRLDWRVLGRTDRPYIKEYDEETNLRSLLILDGSGSMAYGGKDASKFEYAARVAASLAYLMLANTESVGLAIFSREMDHWLAPHAGTGQLARLIDGLERSAPRGPSGLARAIHQAADRLGRRALVIVISDFLSPLPAIREGLARLSHDRHEVIAIRILDSDETLFPFRSWSLFRGLEGEASQIFEPAVARRIYLENFRAHQRQLEEACRSLRAQLAQFVTDRPLIDALTAFLRRRGG